MILILQGTETNTDNLKEKMNAFLELLVEENERLDRLEPRELTRKATGTTVWSTHLSLVKGKSAALVEGKSFKCFSPLSITPLGL